MYVHRDSSGTYFVVLESLELGFGFPAAKTKEYGEVIFELVTYNVNWSKAQQRWSDS
jgi:hypothetical protein